MKENKKILVTGAAGFIGFHLCRKLILENIELIGIDNLNDYYDVNLKKARIKQLESISLEKKSNWNFIRCDLKDNLALSNIFKKKKWFRG